MNRARRCLGAVVFLALVPVNARALTLDEALRSALANNPALAGRVLDVAVADAHTLQAEGLDDFVAGAGATWNRARGSNVAAQQTPVLPYDAGDASASLSRSVSTGATVALKLDAPYVRVGTSLVAGAPGDTGPVEGYQPSAQLSVTQPLLRGRGYDVARAPLRQARLLRDATGWALEDAASTLARDVANAYWELAYQAGDRKLREESLQAGRAQLDAVRAQIDVGKQPPSASAVVVVSIAQRVDDALDSEAAIDERAAELARLLGPEPARASGPLVATDRPTLYGPPDGDPIARAVERNAMLAQLRVQTRASAIDVDVAQNGLLPQLDATLGGGPMGVGTDAAPALRSLASLSGYTVQAGLVFQEPIERRTARGARDAAVASVAKSRTGERDARALVAAATSIALTQLASTRRRIDLLERAARTAELDVESETARFQANRSTRFDVLRRQHALTDVRIALLRAQVDNAKAAAAIDALTDDLLLRHGLAIAATRGAR